MLLDFIIIVLGLAGLFFGGELLIRGATRLATALGVPTLVIGLTVVSLGTSAPELVVSAVAALGGSSDIAIGNVVGSNIANIGLILGIAGLIAPIRIDSGLVRREIPVMIAISAVVFVMASDGAIGRVEGGLLLAGYVVFTVLLYSTAPRPPNEPGVTAEMEAMEGGAGAMTRIDRPRELAFLLGGLVLLAVGAQLTVTGAVNIARGVGISEVVIGLTLVAVGTSLPEIVTSVMAAIRKHDDLAAGNVVGSNIANLLVILGAASLIRPVVVAPELLRFEFPVMLAFAVVPLLFAVNLRLGRGEAAVLLAGYIAFMAVTLL